MSRIVVLFVLLVATAAFAPQAITSFAKVALWALLPALGLWLMLRGLFGRRERR